MKKTLKNSWLIPFGVIFIAFIIHMALKAERDSDMYFMIANGEYILKHGIPYINPFVIHEDFKIIIQQWIPSVVAYLGVKAIGLRFFQIEAVIGLLVLIFAIYKLTCLTLPKEKGFLFASVIGSMMLYLTTGKPMLYSIILLVVQMYLCEKKESWLWLPLIVLIEANIHASFIIFHFVYLLPFIVPGITKHLNNTAEYKYIKALPFMAVSACINPYGLDGALYLFKSYTPNLKKVPITELQPITITNVDGVIALVVFLFAAVQLYRRYIKPHKRVDSHRLYLFMGSVALMILFPQVRNYIFLVIGSIPLMVTEIHSLKGKTPPAKLMWVIAILCLIASVGDPTAWKTDYPRFYAENCAEYLKGKDVVLFNDFDIGGYLEAEGIKIFIDSRPELYFKSINGKEDIIDDYLNMVFKEDRKALIDKYGFTHYCVYKNSALTEYLKTKYPIVAEDETYVLLEASK